MCGLPLLAKGEPVLPTGSILAVALETDSILLLEHAHAGTTVCVALPVRQRKPLQIDAGRWIDAGGRRRLNSSRRFRRRSSFGAARHSRRRSRRRRGDCRTTGDEHRAEHRGRKNTAGEIEFQQIGRANRSKILHHEHAQLRPSASDLANVFGMVKFYKAARARGIKPIIGCDVWISHDAERDAPHRVLLLCQSREGFLRIADWLTRAYRTNQHRGRAELRREWFSEGTAGVIALSGFAGGDIGHALLQGNARGAQGAASTWASLFPERFYLEVQRAGHAEDDALTAAMVRLGAELALPVVATHPVQFATRDEFRAHEARVCISEGYVLADPRRPKRFTPAQYFLTQAEMAKAFADLPDALANSVAIAQRCNLTIPLGKNYLPAFPTPDGVSLEEHLRSEAQAGLERRLVMLYPNAAERESRRPEYAARLEFEAKTIIQMGYAGYFLIVADFINWAKKNGVPVGPGRGSGAGSLIAYSLGITDLDPLRYTLLFERF
ncbi:MAG: PHP domain-containing protein, partial [Betaproteobacteria bacterium]